MLNPNNNVDNSASAPGCPPGLSTPTLDCTLLHHLHEAVGIGLRADPIRERREGRSLQLCFLAASIVPFNSLPKTPDPLISSPSSTLLSRLCCSAESPFPSCRLSRLVRLVLGTLVSGVSRHKQNESENHCRPRTHGRRRPRMMCHCRPRSTDILHLEAGLLCEIWETLHVSFYRCSCQTRFP